MSASVLDGSIAILDRLAADIDNHDALMEQKELEWQLKYKKGTSKLDPTDPAAKTAYWAAAEARRRIAKPWYQLIFEAKKRCIRTGMAYDLTDAWAASVWTGRCGLSGIRFDLTVRGSGPSAFSPSIDRIDPNLGYTRDNVRFVIAAVNFLKGAGTDEQTLMIARALVANYPSAARSTTDRPMGDAA